MSPFTSDTDIQENCCIKLVVSKRTDSIRDIVPVIVNMPPCIHNILQYIQYSVLQYPPLCLPKSMSRFTQLWCFSNEQDKYLILGQLFLCSSPYPA